MTHCLLIICNLGQDGMTNKPDGDQQGLQMMGQLAGRFGEAVMNQLEANVQEQATANYQVTS